MDRPSPPRHTRLEGLRDTSFVDTNHPFELSAMAFTRPVLFCLRRDLGAWHLSVFSVLSTLVMLALYAFVAIFMGLPSHNPPSLDAVLSGLFHLLPKSILALTGLFVVLVVWHARLSRRRPLPPPSGYCGTPWALWYRFTRRDGVVTRLFEPAFVLLVGLFVLPADKPLGIYLLLSGNFLFRHAWAVKRDIRDIRDAQQKRLTEVSFHAKIMQEEVDGIPDPMHRATPSPVRRRRRR